MKISSAANKNKKGECGQMDDNHKEPRLEINSRMMIIIKSTRLESGQN